MAELSPYAKAIMPITYGLFFIKYYALYGDLKDASVSAAATNYISLRGL